MTISMRYDLLCLGVFQQLLIVSCVREQRFIPTFSFGKICLFLKSKYVYYETAFVIISHFRN